MSHLETRHKISQSCFLSFRMNSCSYPKFKNIYCFSFIYISISSESSISNHNIQFPTRNYLFKKRSMSAGSSGRHALLENLILQNKYIVVTTLSLGDPYNLLTNFWRCPKTYPNSCSTQKLKSELFHRFQIYIYISNMYM